VVVGFPPCALSDTRQYPRGLWSRHTGAPAVISLPLPGLPDRAGIQTMRASRLGTGVLLTYRGGQDLAVSGRGP